MPKNYIPVTLAINGEELPGEAQPRMDGSLEDKTVVVTRAPDQAEELISLLKRVGAEVIHLPVIKIVEPKSWVAFDREIARIDDYDWVIFSSANGVRFFCNRLKSLNESPFVLNDKRVAAVGERTKAALNDFGVHVELVPDLFTAEGLVDEFSNKSIVGSKILIPRGQAGRDVLSDGLKALGARVLTVEIYRNQPIMNRNSAEYRRLLNANHLDILTFTSPSTVRNFIELFGDTKIRTWVTRGCELAVIGDVTATALQTRDLQASIVPTRSTIPDLVSAIVNQMTNSERWPVQ